MNDEIPSLLKDLCSELEKHPEHEVSAKAISKHKTGALVFFLPASNESDDQTNWQAAVSDFAGSFPLLSEAGIGILGVVPEIQDPTFPQKFKIPYPTVQFRKDGELPCDLWKLVRGLKTCRYFSYAALLDWESQKVVHEWRRFDPEELEAQVLAYLASEEYLKYSPDSHLVHVIERKHLVDRRSHAADEGKANLGKVQKTPPEQADAYEKTMNADRPAIGLAFSGGGIRSTTFNLGITQALARYRILPWVDYISSVSGGGFMASALVSLLSRRGLRRGSYHFNTQWERFPFNPKIEAFSTNIDQELDEETSEDRNFKDVSYRPGHNTQLSYLIKKGNYLIPRLGLATRDLMRGVGTLLAGTGFTIVLFVLAMFILACMHYFTVGMLTPAILQDLDTTRLTPSEQVSTRMLTLEVAIDGENAKVEVPLGAEAEATEPGEPPAGVRSKFSLPYLLFGSYSADPPLLAPAESDQEAGRIPWLIYLAQFLSGMVAAFIIYQFLTTTYKYPKMGKADDSDSSSDGDNGEELEQAQVISEEGTGEAKLEKAVRAPGPIRPQPERLRSVFWLFLLLAGAGLGVTIGWQSKLADLSNLVYLGAILLAGLLIWLLLRGVPETGTVDRAPWAVWLLSILLAGSGGALAILPLKYYFETDSANASAWFWSPLALLMFILLLFVITRKQVEQWGKHGFDRWERYDPFILRVLLGFLLAVLVLVLGVGKKVSGGELASQIFWIWQPAVFFSGSLVFFSLIRMLVRGQAVVWGSARFRTIIWAMVGTNFYAVLAALLLALLALPHILAVGGESATEPAIPLATALVSGAWAALLAQFSGKETTGGSTLKKLFTLPGSVRNILLGLMVIILWISLIFLFETQLDRLASTPLQAFGLGLIALGVFVLVGTLLNYNYLSPHYFFGDRAAEVFLKTDVETRDGRVVTMRDYTKVPLRSISHPTSSAPYHLVVTAVNLAGSGHLQDRDRKSRHFLFSREFVGSDATGYVQTGHYRAGSTNYGSTIALSGAAASPGLGAFTFFAQAFMMTLLNIRLGQWWVNPKEYRKTAGEDFSQIQEYENRAFWPVYLVDEALARTSERRRLVNLTDGGHTRDNGGLYPLFERRCKLIIGGDASQDAEGLCHDLFSVLHYVRVDLDIQVDINVSRLQPAKEDKDGDQKGMSAAHLAIGKITYPPLYRADGSLKRPEEQGWLVYIKPAVSKAMPAEVLQFWQTDKSMFPHPTTADQFFSERQFEAQRRLGEESVRLSLGALLDAYKNANKDPKSGLQDLNNEKAGFLENLLEQRSIDYVLLKNRPALLDEFMQDWMDTLSPLGEA